MPTAIRAQDYSTKRIIEGPPPGEDGGEATVWRVSVAARKSRNASRHPLPLECSREWRLTGLSGLRSYAKLGAWPHLLTASTTAVAILVHNGQHHASPQTSAILPAMLATMLPSSSPAHCLILGPLSRGSMPLG